MAVRRDVPLGIDAGISRIRTADIPERRIDQIVIGVSPVGIVIGCGPERVIEDIGIGIRPEHRAEPRHECRMHVIAPGLARSPAVQPRRERGLSAWIGIVSELRGKSSARGGLHGGCGRAALPSRGPCTELLLLREIALLRKLLALQQALLSRQGALRPPALRVLGLQLLHALLQAIDPGLALGAAARQRIALALLCELLMLFSPQFMAARGLRNSFLPLSFLPRRTRTDCGRCARAP